MGKFSYRLIKPIGTLFESDNGIYQLECNIISFSGGDPKIDIRRWNRETDQMQKGIALDRDQAERLLDILPAAIEALINTEEIYS